MRSAALLRPRSSVLYPVAAWHGASSADSLARARCREETREYRPSTLGKRRTVLPDRHVRGLRARPAEGPGWRSLERSLRQADALAISLRGALERLAIPLARAAAAFVGARCWWEFGFARLEDHARERFGRSGRWVKDGAALGRALESLPLLSRALTGDDGGRPIGRVAATLVGRVASSASLDAWVALARSVTVRALRDAVGAARAAGSAWPAAPSPAFERQADAVDDPSDRSLVRVPVPAPVLAAFDEVVDLFRCIEGHEATITSFVEALVGEARAAGIPPDTDRSPMKRAAVEALREAALARSTGNWSGLTASSPASWSLALAGVSLARLREIDRIAGTGGAADLDGQIRALIALEDDLQTRLGEVLADLAGRGAWARLRFSGVGHYAEERLGLSRTSAEDRVRVNRSLRRFPLLRAAYESRRVGLEATLLILRILGCGPADSGVERAWVARAEEATVKRLRDEARALGRRESGRAAAPAAPAAAPVAAPLDDHAWHASLRRVPGTARGRVRDFGSAAAERPGPDLFLRLRLPHALAGEFLGAIESFRARLSDLAGSVPWDEPWPDPGAAPSLVVARTFSVRSRVVPAWVGLLALLEDFVLTWDVGPHGRDVYSRSGWRCSAPGCTSRRNLEDHHLVYRSRGGGNALSNRICLCRFHHLRGEHGGLASCRGTAPLDVLWRLGRTHLGAWYRNERRVVPGAAPATLSR